MNILVVFSMFLAALVPDRIRVHSAEETGLVCQPVQRTGQWDIYETSVRINQAFADPFRDVSVYGDFYGPTGKSVRVKGFYEGEREWKVRFMPGVAGRWQYRISTDKDSMISAGEFECIPSEIPGLISTCRENPVWFGYRDGDAVLLRSLHIGDRFFANNDNALTGEKWNPGARVEFLDWAQEQGYNMLSIASHYLNRQQEGRGEGWDTPSLWNNELNQPDPSEYRQMEEVLNDLSRRHIMVYPFAGFFGRASGYPAGKKEQELYIEYTVSRFGAYWNLFYMVGGPEPLWPKKSYLSEEEIDWLARKIKEEDVYGHLLSVHNFTGDDLFVAYPWQDYGILQGPKTTDREKLSREILKNRHPARPLYLQETLWPGNTFGHPGYSNEDIRKNALVMLLSGGTINFGDMDGNSSSGFSGKIDLGLMVQERHDVIHRVWDFFESQPYCGMIPRQDLVSRGYCLAKEGEYYLVYLEEPLPLDVEIIPGKYNAAWIDARNFQDSIDLPVITGSIRLESPENRGDWILKIERYTEIRR